MSTDLQQYPTKESESRLPGFLSISIFALVALGLLTIAALFVDSVENRGSRIFLTFVVFAGFVGLTALDTLRSSKRSWYAPAALVSNFFFLGASVLTIWLSPGNPWGFGTVIFMLIVTFAIVLRLGLLFGVFAMSSVDREDRGGRHVETYERKASIWAAWLGSAAAVLFVIYMAAHHILSSKGYELMVFWDIYLKLSTAVLILAGIAVSIALLLRWFFGADERAARKAYLAGQAHRQSEWAWQLENSQSNGSGQLNTGEDFGKSNRAQADSNGGLTTVTAHPGMGRAEWPTPQAQESLLPWPTFDDGRPFPAGADGQPDFEGAKRIATPEASEIPQGAQGWTAPSGSEGKAPEQWQNETGYPRQ